jgi:predicted site-specific integrase-resolvase
MDSFVSLGEAAQALGISITTLRCWEREGKLISEHRSDCHRRYDLAKMRPEHFRAASDVMRRTVAYARVSSHD